MKRLLPPFALPGALATGLLSVVASSAMPSAAKAPDAIARPASISARAQTAVLLGAARAGSRLVVVGERGIVLLSDDSGATWRQAAASPTSVTLTAVYFASKTQGWATGHAGLILATDDGGEHWQRQLDGKTLAQQSLAQALAALARVTATPTATSTATASPGDPVEAAKAVSDARRLVADGADKPFFGLHFTDAKHGFAVGAYNLFVRTDDGGATWVPAADRLPNPKGKHLYAIGGRGDRVFIVGEQGLLLRSMDGGQTFEAIESPYPGSFFTLAVWPGGELVAAGLRGNALRSVDQGESWQAIGGLPPASWLASAVADDGTAWLGNQAGQVFVSVDAGRHWHAVPPRPGAPGAPLTGLLPLDKARLLTTTVRGMGRLDTPRIAAK